MISRPAITTDRHAPPGGTGPLARRPSGDRFVAVLAVAVLAAVASAAPAAAVPAGVGVHAAPASAVRAVAGVVPARGHRADAVAVPVGAERAGAGVVGARGMRAGPVRAQVGARVVPAGAGAGDGGPAYIPPVAAPVVDPFHLPETPFGPGNRGLEYATVPGTAVRASAGGVVTFAGPVGGSLYVTVAHPDGVRTSYSYLARLAVVLGQTVRQGQVVGVAGARFHFGARVAGEYIDPAGLLSGAAFDVVLLPLGPAPVPVPARLRALRALLCCWWPVVT